MKIAVAGLGYVGKANAAMLSEKFDVTAFDIDEEKVNKTNEEYDKFRINATTDGGGACKDADFVIVATPTDFDEDKNKFDTSSVEDVAGLVLSVNKNACIVIKSTVPVGFTQRLIEKCGYENIIFSPEFLREGSEIYDCLNPSRIVIGSASEFLAEKYKAVLLECVSDRDVPVVLTGTGEAEAIKLFSNAYLAMRVAFFNELDTFAEVKNLKTADIIDGVSKDPRIGEFYNNPSFGYGGYCLPKDTKQLLAEFESISQSMFSAVVESNEKRMDFIADRVSALKPGVVGVYRLSMKAGADNCRSSAVLGIIDRLGKKGMEILVYEPGIREDLGKIKALSDVIIANRCSDELDDVADKVYTRDLYSRD